MHKILTIIIMATILLYFIQMIYFSIKYLKTRRTFRTKLKDYIQEINLGLRPLNQKDTKYIVKVKLLEAANWNISVEGFNLIRYSLAILIPILMIAIHITNMNIEVDIVRNDINFKRSMLDLKLDETEENLQAESRLLDSIESYLNKNNISITSLIAEGTIQAYVNSQDIKYDALDIVAKRMNAKLLKLYNIRNNIVFDLAVILVSFLCFSLPNILLAVKLKLVKNSKDWEVLFCLTTYSIIGRLPPYRVDLLIDNLKDVSNILRKDFSVFRDIIVRKDEIAAEQLIATTRDEDLLQIFETLQLGAELGVMNTVDNIDDMIDTKLHWLEINATRNRQSKYMLAITPVAVTLLLLFVFAMQGLLSLNSMMVM